MDHFDVAVIGAGPAGSMAAKYAAKAGASTILLEEHAGAGWPVQCAGLLGREALAESELAAGSFILGGMKGAAIFSPGGVRLDFKAQDRRAWVVDRRLFDRALVEQALEEKVAFRPCARVEEIRRGRERSILSLAAGEAISAVV
ncbi:MAG TPA: FAD-dependent oxidoreductase, partial [Methanothrix sp.]|nr:FAD-dependent oxidoreductase [Methanothrix sp.]